MSSTKRPRETWNGWSNVPRGPKPPPPAHGIRIRAAGTTWWGLRWIEALEKLSPDYASRLARGKTYARAGRAHDLVVAPGRVTAKVTGSRAEPYAITIAIAPLDDATWDKAVAALAEKARYAAVLLAGEMPKDVGEVLRGVGVEIFPSRVGDLETTCSCPDWANPCKHVAATHYVLGEAFDRDPFLLFELRGRGRERVIGGLRGESGRKSKSPRERESERERASDGVSIGKIGEDSYEKWRGEMPVLRLSFAKVEGHAGVVQALGAIGAWREKKTPVEVLGPIVARAGEHARRIAGRE